ncbi:unnamed protein product [Danaus chrysippus]|uniref:(African queen) hypothetical protein n=1 Tax=Danaus chrysippus TaxID=151541 RepID=A0A8J2R5B3_9NEOP|nr:unnamed protein product [Danaus chrysippus]
MTNLDDHDSCDPRDAALLAVHLVSQVLDEAYVIANAAKESGEPWNYISSLRKLRISRLDDTYEDDMTFTVSKDDYKYVEGNNIDNEVVTSTPQKGNFAKDQNEASFIGQGDENFEVPFVCDEPDTEIQNDIESSDAQNDDILKTIDSYLNDVIDAVFGRDEDKASNSSSSREGSGSNSDLAGAFGSDIAQDVGFYMDDLTSNVAEGNNNVDKETVEKHEVEQVSQSEQNNKDIAAYENAFLTLNRDYDVSDDDDEPVLRDPKSMMMQEIELLTAVTSTDNISPEQDQKTLAATSGVSTQGSRKSNLVRRCRVQGAKLLSCLRGLWWKRKLLGRRKECRGPGSIRGFCPLSPDARRRAASLLDQRNLRTPSPSRSVFWKFNTVNEALVHSSRWKDFGLKMSLNENDEF